MAEPDFLQRQREFLRTFREATARRAEAEAGAAAHRRARHLVGGPSGVATTTRVCYNDIDLPFLDRTFQGRP
jgi:hypothetical protein